MDQTLPVCIETNCLNLLYIKPVIFPGLFPVEKFKIDQSIMVDIVEKFSHCSNVECNRFVNEQCERVSLIF